MDQNRHLLKFHSNIWFISLSNTVKIYVMLVLTRWMSFNFPEVSSYWPIKNTHEVQLNPIQCLNPGCQLKSNRRWLQLLFSNQIVIRMIPHLFVFVTNCQTLWVDGYRAPCQCHVHFSHGPSSYCYGCMIFHMLHIWMVFLLYVFLNESSDWICNWKSSRRIHTLMI